jgi:hypothetical protein
MSRLLTFPCHYIWTDTNELTGSIPSELGELTLLTELFLGTCIRFACSYHCHPRSHFVAILFEQGLINSWGQFRANSEDWRRWLRCICVRGLVCLVIMNVKLAHISLPFYLNRGKSTHGFNSERTRSTYVADSTGFLYVDWFILLAWMSRLLTFPCHNIWTGDNKLLGSIPSDFERLTSLTLLYFRTWICVSCYYDVKLAHISLPFYLNRGKSTHGFNS